MGNYQELGVIQAGQVPDWDRRPPKYSDIVKVVQALAPGQAKPYVFPDVAAAERARNAVRDMVNRQAKKAIVRTRLEEQPEEGQVIVYFIRLAD